MTPKTQLKEKLDRPDIINVKNVCFSKYSIKNVKVKPTSGRKNLQIMYLIRDLNLEYIKNYCNSFIKRQIT